MPNIRVFRKQSKAPEPSPPRVPASKPSPLIGKTVFFRDSADSQSVAGVVREMKGSDTDGIAMVALAIPNHAGVLVVAKDVLIPVPAGSLTVMDAVALVGRDVKSWESNNPIDNKAAVEIKRDGVIVDWRDVSFDGYGSTFQGTTPADRDQDYILPGAFDKSLREFKANPVLLTDHVRSVKAMMGHYSNIAVNERGLALRGNVTNSPHMDAVHVRHLIMEGEPQNPVHRRHVLLP